MSTNSNDKNIVAESRVLTTSLSKTLSKYTLLVAAIGLLIGIVVMLILNSGVIEMLFSPKESAAIAIVAHNASNEEGGESEEETEEEELTKIEQILKECNVDFFKSPSSYTGEVIKVEATNVEAIKAKGVTVTYVNNAHKDVGTYEALAIFSMPGEESVIKTAELKIVKASLNPENYTFESKLVEYAAGTTHSIEVVSNILEGNLPEGVEVVYSMNAAEEVGVYNATAVLYGRNYENLTLTATLTVVDLKELVYFPGLQVIDEETEEKGIVLTYNKKDQTVKLNTVKVLDEIKDNRNFSVVYTVCNEKGEELYTGADVVVTEAGTYIVTATISADGFTPFDVTVKVIVKQGSIQKVHGISFSTGDLEYNGVTKFVTVKSGEESFPENITYVIKYYLVEGEGEDAVYTEVEASEVCKPGNYRAVIELRDSTGNCIDNIEENENLINYDFTILKRDVSWLYTVEDDEDKYAQVTVKHEDGTSEKVGKVHNLVFTFNAENLHSTILAHPLVVTFTYGSESVTVTFTFEKEVIVGSDGKEVETGKNIVVATYTLGGAEITEELEYNNVEFIIPIGFVDQGTYYMDVLVHGNEYDADTTLNPKMVIGYASLSGITVKNNQIVFANGKFQTPKYTSKESGVTVEIFDKDGNPVDGFKYFGFHDVEMVFTKGNYQTTKTIRYIVMFNPLIALIGLVIGILVGLVIGLIMAFYTQKQEKASAVHFRGPGAIVAKARGGIICESFAKNEESSCAGRLYLSSKSLEFYAEDYKALKDNFLIDIDDIRNVDAIAEDRICVYANKQKYIFTVPYGSSREWAASIIEA